MTMKKFNHEFAYTVEEVIDKLKTSEGFTSVIAGGTDILGTLKDKIHPEAQDKLIDLKTVEGLEFIKTDQKGDLVIGSMTRLSDIEKNEAIKEKYPVLAEAVNSIATPQLRNMGTLGGNICQEPRCWYYRKDENMFECLRKGGEICNALTGENQIHSIYGACRVDSTPCTEECPTKIKIADYMNMIRKDDIKSAAEIIMLNNPLAAMTGRVCPHTCMDSCNRGEIDTSVAIRNVERYIGDYCLDNSKEMYKAGEDNEKKAAIIGGGPAGLSAAYYLRKAGTKVTVYEKQAEAGGMLAYGIPAYRLPKDIVRKQIAALKDMGIEFVTGVEVGKDVDFSKLKAENDFVFVGTGAWVQPKLGIENEEKLLAGIEFLKNVVEGKQGKPGEKVLVIGGGNVAVDVALSAKRLGAAEVNVACLEAREEMPAIKHDVEDALKEGINIINGYGISKVLTEGNSLKGIELVGCTSVFDENGRFNPQYDASDIKKLEADCIILAIGQKTDVSFLENTDVETNRSLISVASEKQNTNADNVYAGGDVVTGPATAVKAIAAGRRAAEAFVEGLENCETVEASYRQSILKFDEAALDYSQPEAMEYVSLENREIYVEDALGYIAEQVLKEAKRCYNCGCVAVCPSDAAPALVALDAVVKTSKREIAACDFFATRNKKGNILEKDEIVTEVIVPAVKANVKSAYNKYRIRKSIDFPLMNIAITFDLEDDIVKDSRIVLGAAAPVPFRLIEAENYINGKSINYEVAKEAAELAVKNVLPLKKNRYKVEYVRAYVRRLLLEAKQ